jgi:hypothetical protein
MMREGRERVEWEQLSFLLCTVSRIAGSKKSTMEQFNKFSAIDEAKAPEVVDTKAAMRSLKHSFSKG